jgi:hypothetical protein
LLVAAAGLALLVAGCGSSSPSSTTGAAAVSRQNLASEAFKFADCMRQHGVTNFPDPQVSSGHGQQRIAIAVPADAAKSPQLKAAGQACRGILPTPSQMSAYVKAEQQAHKQGLLAFARCVRSHGATTFPDPTDQGQLTPAMLTAANVDVHAPSVLAAARACIPASEGTVTPAAIAQVESQSP